MATPNLVYRTPEKGAEWKLGTVAGAVKKRADFRKIDRNSKTGLERIAKEYMGSYLLTLTDPDQVKKALQTYDSYLGSGIDSYVLDNLAKAVDSVGQENLDSVALNLPTQKGKGKDLKYDKAASLVGKLRGMEEQTRTKEGIEKLVEDEFKGMDEETKGIWITAVGGFKGVIEQVKARIAGEAIVSINDYGLVGYMKDAMAISETAGKDYEKAAKELQDKMEKDVEKLRKKLGTNPTPVQLGEINDKYKPQEEALQEKYGRLLGARKIILEGNGEDMPGLISLAVNKYETDEKKKAEEEARKKEQKKWREAGEKLKAA